MRIAWFRDTAPDRHRSARRHGVAHRRAALRRTTSTSSSKQTAHDFVWQQHARPWDLCVFELDNTRGTSISSRRISLNYPGVVFAARSADVATLCARCCSSTSVVDRRDSGFQGRFSKRVSDAAHVRYCACHVACDAARVRPRTRIPTARARFAPIERPSASVGRRLTGSRCVDRRRRASSDVAHAPSESRATCGRHLRSAERGRGAERV